MSANTQLLQRVIDAEIPLSRAMGIRASRYDSETLTLTAPLDNNTNHKNTAFGGSLYSLAVLCGWGLLYLRLQEQNLQPHIVIHHSETTYIKPVTGTLTAVASIDPAAFERCIRLFKRKGKARIRIKSRITQDGSDAAIFVGRYVIHR